MTSNAKRTMGALAAVALLGGAAAGAVAAGTAAERRSSEALLEKAEQRRDLAAGLLATRLKEVESRATAAASMLQIRALAASPTDRATLADSFGTEDWWRSYREEAAVYQLLVGDPARDFTSVPDGLRSEEIAEQARSRRSASGVIAGPAGPLVVAAAVVDVPLPGGGQPLVVLAYGLDAATLGPLAEKVGGALLLTDGTRALASAGRAEHVAALVALQGQEAAGPKAQRQRGFGAAAATLAPGIHLWAHATGEAASAAPVQAGLVGAGLLGALVALFLGFRTPRVDATVSPDELRAAEAQLAAAQRTLSRLSSTAQAVPLGTLPGTTDAAPPPPASAPVPAGTLVQRAASGSVFGRYHIIEKLGEGGMAEVFTAVVFGAEGFKRTFVVKRLRAELSRHTEAVAQFIDEARLGASLVHGNIIPVFDFGKVGEEYYLATEFILGRDLHQLASRSRQVDGHGLPPALAVLAMRELLQALAYAHARTDDAGRPLRLVHRDVSPANVMVSARGEVRLFDFGIVKAAGRVTQTEHGMVKGNPSLMAPEQARGLEVDPRTDLFSVGLVLYFCLTGEFLYQAETPYEQLVRAAGGPGDAELARVDRLPAPFPALLRKAIAVSPAARFQDAGEFLAALATLPTGTTAELAALVQRLFGQELRADEVRMAAAMPVAPGVER